MLTASFAVAFEVSPAAAFRIFNPPSCAYDAMAFCASASLAFKLSMVSGADTDCAAEVTVSLIEVVVDLGWAMEELEAAALRCWGVNVSSRGEGER